MSSAVKLCMFLVVVVLGFNEFVAGQVDFCLEHHLVLVTHI